MCEHCGYKPGESKVIHRVIIFERDPDQEGESLGIHLEGSPDYTSTEEFLSKHDGNAFIEVGTVLDMLTDQYIKEAFNRAAPEEPNEGSEDIAPGYLKLLN